VVAIYYFGGDIWDGKTLHFPELKHWTEHCEHAQPTTSEGMFYADKYGSEEGYPTRYRRISCEYCARKLGVIW
jgi:hypothetical protein